MEDFITELEDLRYPGIDEKLLGKSIEVPYKANSALIWINTSSTIHGRKPLPRTHERKYIFAFHFLLEDKVLPLLVFPMCPLSDSLDFS